MCYKDEDGIPIQEGDIRVRSHGFPEEHEETILIANLNYRDAMVMNTDFEISECRTCELCDTKFTKNVKFHESRADMLKAFMDFIEEEE